MALQPPWLVQRAVAAASRQALSTELLSASLFSTGHYHGKTTTVLIIVCCLFFLPSVSPPTPGLFFYSL